MILLNEREQVKQAIKNWVTYYGLEKSYGFDKRGRHVGRELLALNAETATAGDVAEIVGNKSWVSERKCDECGKANWELVQLGPDYEGCTADVCRDCLMAALQLLDDAGKPGEPK